MCVHVCVGVGLCVCVYVSVSIYVCVCVICVCTVPYGGNVTPASIVTRSRPAGDPRSPSADPRPPSARRAYWWAGSRLNNCKALRVDAGGRVHFRPFKGEYYSLSDSTETKSLINQQKIRKKTALLMNENSKMFSLAPLEYIVLFFLSFV